MPARLWAAMTRSWRSCGGTSRHSEAELRELNRLVERVGGRLHDLLGEARAETARLQENLSKGLDESRQHVEGRMQELRGLVCASELEQGKSAKQAQQEMQAWQAHAEQRLSNLDNGLANAMAEALRCGETMREDLRKACEEMKERDGLLEASQRGAHEALHGEAKALSDKQTRCASELHRLVRGIGQKVDASRDHHVGLEEKISKVHDQLVEEHESISSHLQACLSKAVAEASEARAAMEQRLGVELATWTAEPAALASAEERLSKEDAATRERLEAEIAAVRSWSSEHLDTEAGKLAKLITELSSEVKSLAIRLTNQEEKSAALSAALKGTEERLSSEDAANRERVATLATSLSGAESRLAGENAVTREQLSALSTSLATAESRLRNEDAITREQMDTISAENSRGQRELSKRLEVLAASLAGTESRLTGEDAAARERLEALSATLAGTEKRLSSEDAEIKKQVDRLATSLSSCEARLGSEDATLRERLDALAAALSGAESRLNREDASARERLEMLGATLTSLEGRCGSSEAALRQRLEALSSESRWGRDHAAARKQLESLSSGLTSVESRLASEDAFLRARVEALSTAFDTAETRRGTEEAATRERLESLGSSLASAESRLGREGAVTRDRLELLAGSLTTAENRLAGESSGLKKQLEALTSTVSRTENQSGSDIAVAREKLEALGTALDGAEKRLAAEDVAIRERIEERVKEEVSWILSLVKPIQQSIDKLAWGFHDLGCSHVRCSREFEVLEQVIKDVEVRVLPWRSGLDRETLRMARLVQPGTACATLTDAPPGPNSSPGCRIVVSDGASGSYPLQQPPGAGRPRGVRHRPEYGEQRPASALADLKLPAAVPANLALVAARAAQTPPVGQSLVRTEDF
eukprot:CAMPEP_0179196852 /NCGR_PEP_ID=MMETSP0796-20121207/97890_1 /TAXON_ID=73915 /ORGANISM="Pyrodinium bahamense, Strain pbaha01" /LENGTH=884 /DNA_ID=CAMNT_0020901269 /DNA_START=76 /DNA_END=2731 /DNA_ORIENTATION=+